MVIYVYMESSSDGGETADGCYAELIAKFDSEETYNICSPALEAAAKEANCVITESVRDEEDLTDKEMLN